MEGFRYRLRVRYSDCDPQGVLFNAHYLTYFDIAITELWREAMGSYEEMRKLGVDLVVAEATVRYRAPIHFDAEVDLLPRINHLGTTSIITGISIESEAGLHAEGEIRHVVVRLGSAEKTPIPDALRQALEPFSG
ncbi:MAG: thioesterase family protein [Solirubrobacterales bacterium]|jgi:acyl-CoA thioester hydrolase